MRIGIFVNNPTQFEGPLYRFATDAGGAELKVIYTNSDIIHGVYDPELSKNIDWGIDLTGGYDYEVMPNKGWFGWLFREIRRGRYDLIVVSGYNSRKYICVALIGKLLGKAVALRIDSVLFNQPATKILLKKLAYTFLFSLYDRYFTVGKLATEYLAFFGIHSDRVSLFGYAVDVEYFRRFSTIDDGTRGAARARYGIPSDAVVILSIAKFNDREAPWDLLKAFCSMKVPRLFLLLVGDGSQRGALEAYATGLSDRVIFAGYILYPELPRIYAVSDLFVHPSKNEPWGVSVAEAMACGLPVVTSTRVGSGYDLVEQGKNGFMYESGNPDDLREKIIATLALAANGGVRERNAAILNRWDYATTWQNIVETCRGTCFS